MDYRDMALSRRRILQMTSAVGVASLAGCSDSIPGGGGNGNEAQKGNKYEPGDDAEAMLSTDYFGEDWTEQEVEGDSVGEDDEGPEAETSSTRQFFNGDETEAVLVGIGITDEPETAATIIDDWATANIIQGESVDLGDGGERGEVEGFGAVGFSDSNAAIFSLATREAGLELQPMNGRAYTVAQDVLDNLEEL
jgi:hypothetical protein